MSASSEVVIALGANLGDRRATLDAAVAHLDSLPGVHVSDVSPWIETAPEGGPANQPPYLNGVLFATCTGTARELLTVLHRVEREFGRRRESEERNGPRRLDLDLLLFGEERHDEPDLRVPHPRMEERLFVLQPMEALAPDLKLPSGVRVRERCAELLAAPGSGSGSGSKPGSGPG